MIGFGEIKTVRKWVWPLIMGVTFITGGIGNVGHLVTIKGWEKDTFVSLSFASLLFEC